MKRKKRWVNPLRFFPAIQNLRRVVNSELIEVLVAGGSTEDKIQIPDQQNLRNVRLMGVVSYSQEEVPISIVSKTGVAPLTLLQSTFLTLQGYNGDNFTWQTPLVALRNLGSALNLQQMSPRVFNSQRVNWPKSYIEIADTSLIPAADSVILLEVFYKESYVKQEKQNEASFRNRS